MKYSIRMRSAKGGAHEEGGVHISGAERIVEESTLERITQELVSRALHHSKGKADFIRITIDAIDEEQVITVPKLAIASTIVTDYHQGREVAQELLIKNGISPIAAKIAMETLSNLTDNYRGALLMDAYTGERLDTTGNRGVRVTHMDYHHSEKTKEDFPQEQCSNVHFMEALVLASKVQSCPGIIGELCWSDDPDYVTGYVAGQGVYHRLSHLKPMGSPLGGRVFFVDTKAKFNLDEIINYLEKQVVIVE